MREEYERRWAEKTKPYPGVPELLAELSRLNVKTAVLSNKPDAFTQKCVARLLPGNSFAVIRGARAGVPLKPDPTAALAVAEELNISPSQCLYLGDSGIDMQTANAAGMFPVGALWGFRSEEELRNNGAALLLKIPETLQRYV
jgi:phosphoglycolate phosphatase